MPQLYAKQVYYVSKNPYLDMYNIGWSNYPNFS